MFVFVLFFSAPVTKLRFPPWVEVSGDMRKGHMSHSTVGIEAREEWPGKVPSIEVYSRSQLKVSFKKPFKIVHEYGHAPLPQCTHGGQRTTFGSHFSPYTFEFQALYSSCRACGELFTLLAIRKEAKAWVSSWSCGVLRDSSYFSIGAGAAGMGPHC